MKKQLTLVLLILVFALALSACGAAEGKNPQLSTEGEEPQLSAEAEALQGTWECSVPITQLTDELDVLAGHGKVLNVRLVLDLRQDGTMEQYAYIPNEDTFRYALADFMLDIAYEEIGGQPPTFDEANELFLEQYGTDVFGYMARYTHWDPDSILESVRLQGVYDAASGQLCLSSNMENDIISMSYTAEGDTLTLGRDLTGSDGENTVLTRIS